MKTATSAIWNAANAGQLGIARANQGRSHRPYCGEYTLFDRRKQAISGKPSVHRGNAGWRTVLISSSAPKLATNRTADHRFTAPVDTHAGAQWRHATYQKLSKSATRSELKRKNSNQELGAAITNGRLTTSQVPTVHQRSRTDRSGSRSWMPCRKRGTTRSAG